MHRLVEVRSDGQLVTKGDANQSRDSSTVGFDAVHGAAFLRIPYAGLPNFWLRTDQPLPLVGCGVLALLLDGRYPTRPTPRGRGRGVSDVGIAADGCPACIVQRPPAPCWLVLGSGALSLPPAEAQAAYSAKTAPAASTWGTTCGDVTQSTGGTAVPVLRKRYRCRLVGRPRPQRLRGHRHDPERGEPGDLHRRCEPSASFDGVSGVVDGSTAGPPDVAHGRDMVRRRARGRRRGARRLRQLGDRSVVHRRGRRRCTWGTRAS